MLVVVPDFGQQMEPQPNVGVHTPSSSFPSSSSLLFFSRTPPTPPPKMEKRVLAEFLGPD